MYNTFYAGTSDADPSTLIQFNITAVTLKKRIANINTTMLKSAASGWSSRLKKSEIIYGSNELLFIKLI